MANMLFANNCNTTLSSSLTNVATTMSVTSATGFPSPTGSQYFYCTLADAATQTTIEIVKVTAVSGTTFTIVRGQDGTTGTAFNSGDVVSLRLVRASLNDFPKLDENNTFTYAPTFNTALAVGSGGTGLTNLTANYIPYGNGTSAFNFSSNFTYNGTGIALGSGGTASYPIDILDSPSSLNNTIRVNNTNGTSGTGNQLAFQSNNTNVATYGWNYTGGIFYSTITSYQHITFSTAGASPTEKMRIFGSGGVSIGNTTDPGAGNLLVNGNGFFGTTSSGGGRLNVKSSTSSTTYGQAITFSDATADGGYANLTLSTTSTNNRQLSFGIDETNGWTWQQNIQQGVGTTPHRFYSYTTYCGSFTGGAWYQGNNSTLWSITSDVRIKKDITSVKNGLEIINALNPVNYYNLITEKNETSFIAQEYEQILPDHVTEEKATEKELDYCLDGKIKRLNPNLIPYLVDAIQTLTARLKLLERKANDNTNT